MAEPGRPSEPDSVPRRHKIDELVGTVRMGATVMHSAPTRLRFMGGPLDGQEHVAESAAEVYRMAGGEYRVRASGDGGDAAAYDWRPDAPVSWHEGMPAASDI